MSADDMRDFIQEINMLVNEGLIINEQRFELDIHSFICDTPARAFLKGIKGHGGYWACERCEIKGIRLKRRTIYPEIVNEELITRSAFKRNLSIINTIRHC